jgi:hypothetical protein
LARARLSVSPPSGLPPCRRERASGEPGGDVGGDSRRLDDREVVMARLMLRWKGSALGCGGAGAGGRGGAWVGWEGERPEGASGACAVREGSWALGRFDLVGQRCVVCEELGVKGSPARARRGRPARGRCARWPAIPLGHTPPPNLLEPRPPATCSAPHPLRVCPGPAAAPVAASQAKIWWQGGFSPKIRSPPPRACPAHAPTPAPATPTTSTTPHVPLTPRTLASPASSIRGMVSFRHLSSGAAAAAAPRASRALDPRLAAVTSNVRKTPTLPASLTASASAATPLSVSRLPLTSSSCSCRPWRWAAGGQGRRGGVCV